MNSNCIFDTQGNPETFNSLDEIRLDDIGFAKNEIKVVNNKLTAHSHLYNVPSNTLNSRKSHGANVRGRRQSSPTLNQKTVLTTLISNEVNDMVETCGRLKVFTLNRLVLYIVYSETF